MATGRAGTAPLPFAVAGALRERGRGRRRWRWIGRRWRRARLATAMQQGEMFHRIDVLRLDPLAAAPGRMGARRAQPDQVGAQAIDSRLEAASGDAIQRRIVQGIRASCRRASAQRRRRVSCWPSQRSTKACGSASKASRRRMISARSAGGGWVSRRTLRPKRSSSCGRSSPSSGFIVPISTKRAGCRWKCHRARPG